MFATPGGLETSCWRRPESNEGPHDRRGYETAERRPASPVHRVGRRGIVGNRWSAKWKMLCFPATRRSIISWSSERSSKGLATGFAHSATLRQLCTPSRNGGSTSCAVSRVSSPSRRGGGAVFSEGLSVVDPMFHLGWKGHPTWFALGGSRWQS